MAAKNSKKFTLPRILRVGVPLLVLLIAGILILTGIMTRQEKRRQIGEILDKGNYLASLIALRPLNQFRGEKGAFFLRTLTEYISSDGLLYCVIHDGAGRAVVSLAPKGRGFLVPNNVKIRALALPGLTTQTFNLPGSKQTVYEFAKPIFEGGKKAGTVRLGLVIPRLPLFPLERISLFALIAFLVFATLAFGYYGITLALNPLKKLSHDFKNSNLVSIPSPPGRASTGRIGPLIADLEQSLPQIKEKLKDIEADNVKLASRLGVITFEKKQIINILDSMDFGVIITDIQDNVTHANRYMLSLFKKAPEEVMDHPLQDILSNRELAEFFSRKEAMGRAGTGAHVDIRFPEIAAEDTFRVSLAYIADGDSEPIAKMISLKNVTTEKTAEKAQQGFIAHVAHELLTPLTNIKSYSEMLMDGEIDDTEMQKEFYNTINEETNRLSSLIKNLLNISKMEVGSLTLNKGLVRTDWFVESCLTPIEASARDKHITIERQLPDTFPSLMADKELLKAAIINILGNALKYTPENGQITFSIADENSSVVFEVIDTGYGISEEDLPHIFEKFYRSGDSDVTKQAGSGLGLAITSEIIQLHEGEIQVQSELAKGTQFTVRIPKEEYRIGRA